MKTTRISFLLAITAAVASAQQETLRGSYEEAKLEDQFTCTTEGLNDHDLCQSAVDDFDQSCVWCASSSGFGLCVSADQSSLIAQLMPDVECSKEILVEKPVEDIYDPACLTAGIQGGDDGEAACGDAQDVDGNPCVWCDAAGVFGLCLNQEQADIAAQFGGDYLTCDKTKPAARLYSWDTKKEDTPIPPDIPECFSLNKEDACSAASEPSCLWCNTVAGFGLCFSEELADLAQKMYGPLFDCDGSSPLIAEAEIVEEEEDIEAVMTETLEDPLDPSCILAIANADQDEAKGICKNTTDTDGNPCVWCTLADVYGICLNQEQSDIASQYLTCDSGGDQGETEEVDDQITAVFKEEIIKTKALENPYDPACTLAAWQADDAESTCGDSADSEGDACVWCEAPTNNAGVCLNHDQAEIASQWLSCNLVEIALE